MNKWKYDMTAYGKPFRELFKNEEETIERIIKTYECMILFLKAWRKRLTVEDREVFEYDIDCLIEDMECACPDINEEDYDEEVLNVNEYLRQFYDICDKRRCWIGV